MRFARLITWICAACVAGIAAVYAFALVHMLLMGGYIPEFSKVPTGRTFTWANEPILMVVSALCHAMLLGFIVMLAVLTWRTLPAALGRMQSAFRRMSTFQRCMLYACSLASVATLAALALGLPAGKMRAPVIAAIWLSWLAVCVQIPLWAWRLGEVPNRAGKVFRRSDDAGAFWRQWATVAGWCGSLLGLATWVCWIHW